MTLQTIVKAANVLKQRVKLELVPELGDLQVIQSPKTAARGRIAANTQYVYDVISKNRKGVDVKILKKRTGLGLEQIGKVITKLRKAVRIKRTIKGTSVVQIPGKSNCVNSN